MLAEARAAREARDCWWSEFKGKGASKKTKYLLEQLPDQCWTRGSEAVGMWRLGLESDLSFAWTRTVELEVEGVRVVVPTDFKAIFEADNLENIVVVFSKMRKGERAWV
jgi:hypothetical protein